jgi:hypothetical protein
MGIYERHRPCLRAEHVLGWQYLVVARDPNAIKAVSGISNVVGLCRQADNAGERIDLSNANGAS